MQRPTFIARQASRPSGLVGRVLGAIMFFETRAFNDEVLRRLAIRPGERILEIGFGHGRTLERATRMHADATFAGIDHALDMVKTLARRCAPLVKSGRLELRAGDSASLPWRDASFDGVFAVHTLYFWPQPERDVAEIARVLKPDGRLLLAFRKRTPQVEAAFPAEIYRFKSQDEVTALVTGAGLEVEMFAGPQPDLLIADGRRRWPCRERCAGRP
jgi:ubiquinone/menaquinone biosynthesis C-methylase UbiE